MSIVRGLFRSDCHEYDKNSIKNPFFSIYVYDSNLNLNHVKLCRYSLLNVPQSVFIIFLFTICAVQIRSCIFWLCCECSSAGPMFAKTIHIERGSNPFCPHSTLHILIELINLYYSHSLVNHWFSTPIFNTLKMSFQFICFPIFQALFSISTTYCVVVSKWF